MVRTLLRNNTQQTSSSLRFIAPAACKDINLQKLDPTLPTTGTDGNNKDPTNGITPQGSGNANFEWVSIRESSGKLDLETVKHVRSYVARNIRRKSRKNKTSSLESHGPSPSYAPSSSTHDKKHQESEVLLKYSILDTYDFSLLTLDPKAKDLVQFYMDWADLRSSGLVNRGQQLNSQHLSSWPAKILKMAYSDELQMLSLLAFTSTMMESLQFEHCVDLGARYRLQRALASLRTRLHSGTAEMIPLLYSIPLLCRAADQQDDDFGVLTHFHAIEQLVEGAGGFQAVPSQMIAPLITLDLGLALHRLQSPMFNFVLGAEAGQLPQCRAVKLTDKLVEIVTSSSWKCADDAKVGGLLQEVIKCSKSSHFVHYAITHRLLSLRPEGQDNDQFSFIAETTRVSLLLWNYLLFATRLGMKRVERNVRIFKNRAFAPYEAVEFINVSTALRKWNAIISGHPVGAAGRQSEQFIRSLVQVVQDLKCHRTATIGYLIKQHILS